MPPQDPNQQQIPTQVRPISRAPAEPVTSTPYDFIMNPSTKPPKKAVFSSQSVKGPSRLLLFAVGGASLVGLAIVAFSLLSGGSSNPNILKIAQQQAEIARVAGLHDAELQTANIKNFAITTELSMKSAQTDYLAYVSSHGGKIDSKQIGLGTNTQTDTTLSNAGTSGTLDSTLQSTLRTQLEQYQQTLQATYKSVSNADTKAVLEALFNQVTLLLQQGKS